MTPMLEVTGLRAAYNRIPILNGIDLTIKPGEFVGILGNNGMGKTTTLRTIAGHLPATAGKIALDGVDVTKLPAYERARMGLGYVPQGRQIFPDLSVMENLRIGAVAQGRDGEGALALLEDFPLLARLTDRRGGDLSGGEQQVLAIARCLAGEPRLILFDEPTEGIQPSIIDSIAESLKRLHEKRGLTILLVEQNLEFIAELAERVLIIQKGRFVHEASPADIMKTDLMREVGLVD